jgi:hypothetical protein
MTSLVGVFWLTPAWCQNCDLCFALLPSAPALKHFLAVSPRLVISLLGSLISIWKIRGLSCNDST